MDKSPFFLRFVCMKRGGTASAVVKKREGAPSLETVSSLEAVQTNLTVGMSSDAPTLGSGSRSLRGLYCYFFRFS
jgi:hypothetical protein